MPAQFDPSIITAGLQRVQPISPQEAMGQQLRLRALQQQIDSNNALEQERRQDYAKQQQQEQQATQFGQAVQQHYTTGPDGTVRINRQSLIQAVPPPLVGEAIKFADLVEKGEADRQKASLDTRKTQAELQGLQQELLADTAAATQKRGNQPGFFLLGLDIHEKNGTVTPEEATAYKMEAIEGGPEAVKTITDGWLAGSLKRQTLASQDAAREATANRPFSINGSLVSPTGKVIATVPRQDVPKSLQHVETAAGIQTFNPETGTLGPVIAKGKPTAAERDPDQGKLEQQYRTILARAMSSRSGGIGLEDSKVQQANHLLGMLDQFHDPKTGDFNIPRVQLNELALGLARLTSPSGQAGVQMLQEFQQKTAKGDIAGALTYLTGQPVAANTQAITKMLKESIERQGQIAEENREGEMRYLRGLVPTELEESRRAALESTSLNPLRRSKVLIGPNGERRTVTSTDGGKTWK